MSRYKVVICVLGLAVIFSPFAFTQDIVVNAQPITVRERLKQYKIGLTKDALVKALHNPDAEIRKLAATQLAGEKQRDTIPEIVSALDAEKVPDTRVNIAFALTWLGEPKGFSVLKDACNEANLPGYLRTRAASYLLEASDEGCLGAAMNLAEFGAESTDRAAALQLLPRFSKVSEDDSERITRIISKSFADSTPVVRLTASSAALELGNQLLVPDLQKAIVVESDDVIRTKMQKDLRRLHEKAH